MWFPWEAMGQSGEAITGINADSDGEQKEN